MPRFILFVPTITGLLSAVGSLNVGSENESTVSLRWTAPFTLDISFREDDITYCVDVVSSTSLHSECGINVTEFTYPLPPRSWCDEYNFTVTPVNLVGNGTRESVDYSQVLPSMFAKRLLYQNAFTFL